MAEPSTPPTRYASVQVATCNVLNLALPQRSFYPNQKPYSDADYQRKIDWLGERVRTLNADVLAFQEVWDQAALQAALARSGLHYEHLVVPGAENGGDDKAAPVDAQTNTSTGAQTGAQGTPRVGFATRLAVEHSESWPDFPEHAAIDVPDLGVRTQFERPPLLLSLRLPHGQPLHVITAHLKSKRPKFLHDSQGQALEDNNDPAVVARATLRSLLIRAAEALALRLKVIELLHRTRTPLVLMGDLNDGPHSATTQLITATSDVAYDRSAFDTSLFNAWDVQRQALHRDVAYSHIHQGWPEVLDQILVSEEFVPDSRRRLAEVLRVEVFNDHLHQGRDRSRSDHGFVRALLQFPLPQ